MKKYFNRSFKYAWMVVAALGFMACGDDKNDVARRLSVSSGGSEVVSIAVNAGGATQTLDVKSDGEWKILLLGANTRWIQLGPSSGKNDGTVTVIYEKNTTTTNRVAEISFVGSDNRELAVIPVAQAGYGPNLAITSGSTEIPEEGGKVSFRIASNDDEWEYTCSGDEWLIQTEKSPSTLEFYAPKNTGKEKSVTLTFQLTRYPEITEEAVITQVAQEVVPTFITLNAPSASEINLGDAEDLQFEWAGTNISGGYILEISASADMSSPLKSIETADESAALPAIDLDLALMQDNVTSGAGKSFYWSVKPRDAAAELTQALEVRELKLKRPVIRTDAVHGDMLDAVFNPDLTVTDVSGNSYTINHRDYDHTTKVVYNRTYQRYMAVFDPKKGNGGTTGNEDGDYYRFDYNTSLATVQPFMDGLADGHSFECLVKFDFNYTGASPTYETKFFSTQGSGGTGFLVTNASQATGGNALAFIPNIGGWKWTNSQIKPDGAAYYHLVGVWDKTAGKSYLYVDGVLKGEADAAGNYTPAAATSRWICIGGDAGNMNAEGCFKGNLVIARVYDRALTATEATALWNQVK